MCALHSLLFSSFAKLDLIEVNESMKLKGSEMGTKMQKIESRSYSSSILQARKLWKITTSCGARGPSHNPHLRPAQQHSLSSTPVVLGHLSQILS